MRGKILEHVHCKELYLTIFISLSITLTFSSLNSIAERLKVFKEVLETMIYVSCLSHVFLYLTDYPIAEILFSFSVQFSLHKLLRTFPVIHLKSLPFCYTSMGLALNFILFLNKAIEPNSKLIETITCFLITSTSPIALIYYISNMNIEIYSK